MIRPMRVVRGPEVEEWLASPSTDTKSSEIARSRFLRAERIIQQAGTLAGDEYLKKLPGYDGLFETTVGDRRIFSTIVRNEVLMAVVVLKKKKRLGPSQLRQIESKVKKFAESRKGGGNGG